MKVWIRNLTKDYDRAIELPMEESKLDDVLNPNDEYILIDSEILNVGEYDSIDELNKFLFDCEEKGISLEELEVLSRIMYYREVIEAVNNGSYVIVDFDDVTSEWRCGDGGDIYDDSHKGMCLFDSGYYNPFAFDMTEDIYDWIDWDSVWINANTDGWQTVVINGNGYLVHR